MSMTASDMATAIVNELLTMTLTLPDGTSKTIQDLTNSSAQDQMVQSWTKICTGLIQYIQDNAKVQVTVATHLHTGVTTGPGTSGPPVVGPTAIEYGDPTAIPPTGGVS